MSSRFPRSPYDREGDIVYLPRMLEKIRMKQHGELPEDYHANLGKGFDGAWLTAAGLTHEQMVEVVKNSLTDGQVADWVRQHVKKTDAEKRAHAEAMLSYPKPEDAEGQARLKLRKEQGGLSHRDDVRTFVDFIDADEKRS